MSCNSWAVKQIQMSVYDSRVYISSNSSEYQKYVLLTPELFGGHCGLPGPPIDIGGIPGPPGGLIPGPGPYDGPRGPIPGLGGVIRGPIGDIPPGPRH